MKAPDGDIDWFTTDRFSCTWVFKTAQIGYLNVHFGIVSQNSILRGKWQLPQGAVLFSLGSINDEGLLLLTLSRNLVWLSGLKHEPGL